MLKKIQNCSGCHACASICPKSCITMKTDKDGFWYPQVNKTDCINCHLCEKVCPILSALPVSDKNAPVAYAAYNIDEKTRLESSSGGIFSLLAQKILSDGGVVFGASFNDRFEVEHIAVDPVDDLYKLRGSKYVQSRIGDSYQQAKRFLENGRTVLFTGTPCQIGGLKSFLGKEYDRLYTQDIICHGVPSPMVWQRYVKFREKKAASSTRRTFSRHKKYGWKMFSVQFEFTNCTEYIQAHSVDLYMTSFLRNWSLRPSCYDCHFKSLQRQADITLADFWGIQNVAPEMDDDKGTSLVLIHSEKGERLWDSVAEQMVFRSVSVEQAIQYNSSAVQSVAEPPNRAAFLKAIRKRDFEKTVQKYTRQKKRFTFKKIPQRVLRKMIGNKNLEALKRKIRR